MDSMSPQYIRDLFIDHSPARQLRSSSLNQLQEPQSELESAGDRAFSVFTPRLWNNTEVKILRHIGSVDSFEARGKTSNFKQDIG